MNKKTFHFEGLRLHVSPQTRISSLSHTPGFLSYQSIIDFCNSVGFNDGDYGIYYYDRNGNKIAVTPENHANMVKWADED